MICQTEDLKLKKMGNSSKKELKELNTFFSRKEIGTDELEELFKKECGKEKEMSAEKAERFFEKVFRSLNMNLEKVNSNITFF